MTRDEAFSECEATVRRFDPDRYFAGLFAPTGSRRLLFALYAFHHELVRVNSVTREPMIAEIRLQWWRDAVDAAARGEPPSHPAAVGIAEAFARTSMSIDAFGNLIDAYAPDRIPSPFAEVISLESFADSTSAQLMRIAVTILDMQLHGNDEIIREAGIAYGLVRTLELFPLQVARSSHADTAAAMIQVSQISEAARIHMKRARTGDIPRNLLPGVLPAALVPTYISRAERVRDPLRERAEISPLRRQLVLFRAALLGRV